MILVKHSFLDYLLNELKLGHRKIVTLFPDSWLQNMIYHCHKRPYSALREATRNATFHKVKTIDEALYQLRQKKAIFSSLSDEQFNYVLIKNCDIVKSKFEFTPQKARIMLLKGNPLTAMLNDSIKRNQRKLSTITKMYLGEDKMGETVCADFKFGDPLSKHNLIIGWLF